MDLLRYMYYKTFIFVKLCCRWQGEFRNCSKMFKVKKTDDGYCCSFNTFDVSEVSYNSSAGFM